MEMKKHIWYGILLMCFLGCTIGVYAQSDTTDNLAVESTVCGKNTILQAELDYQVGGFFTCISRLNSCIQRNGFAENEKIDAMKWIAMAYLAMDSIEAANRTITALLTLKDNFETELRDPERLKLQVRFIRASMQANLTTSVSKKAEKIELAPATIQVITEEDIKRRGYLDITQIFYDLPGFDVSRTFGTSYATVYQRGYRTSALTERMLFMIDGVDDNELWTNAVYLSRQFPISNIKRIEIIYGPASTIYGPNAFTGVVNIVTKSPSDVFNNKDISGKRLVNVNGMATKGALNTNLAEINGTLGSNGVFVQGTARYFTSNDLDLSQFPNWDGKWKSSPENYKGIMSVDTFKRYGSNNDLNAKSYFKEIDKNGLYYTYTADSTQIIPTAYALKKMDSLDQMNYQMGKKYLGQTGPQFISRRKDFSENNGNFYLSTKITLGDFVVGGQYWESVEGASPDYVDSLFAVNSDFNSWHVRQQIYFCKYTKRFGDKLIVTNNTYFKTSDFGSNSVLTTYRSYANGGGREGQLSLDSLILNVEPGFIRRYYAQQSKQYRDELRFNYQINQHSDLIFGAEIRNGLLQVDYITHIRDNPTLYGRVDPKLEGGNHITVVDFGSFGQYNYSNPIKFLNIGIGGRVDNKVYNENDSLGYKLKFNPRYSIVYYPNKWIFKAIYSEAIMDASQYNRFSTIPNVKVRNKLLVPEKVRDLELVVYKALGADNKSSIELNGFYSSYLNITRNALENNLEKFENEGTAQIMGLQTALKLNISENIYFYANTTHLNTKVFETDSIRTKVMSDISPFNANAGLGVFIPRIKTNVQLMLNHVSAKPTGWETFGSLSNLKEIPGYQLVNMNIDVQVFKQVRLQLRGYNITNTKFFSPGARLGTGSYSAIIPQYGRMFSGTMLFNF
jgi:outer membrane receptor for ferrienterochelin and colicins